ncbi:MAG: hypothetical protein RL580_2072 [Pseudomonadota bacterium]|jgi:hypothetical protein
MKLPFQTSLLLAPLAYAIHHGEEHLVFNFRAWRLQYFADNNQLSTEAVLVILLAISMVYILLHATIRNRVSAWMALVFLMATQVHNAIFHLGGTLVFRDFSPGLITALLLYVPVNALIIRSALEEGLVSGKILWALFLAGGLLFWGFEVVGPLVLLFGVTVTWLWALLSARNSTAVV